jgi:hypothetical protein
MAKVQKRYTTEKLETVSVMSQQTCIRMELTLIRVMALEKPDHLAWPILHVHLHQASDLWIIAATQVMQTNRVTQLVPHVDERQLRTWQS